MRILMTADTIGGVWQYTVDLARELAAQGARVAIATMGAPMAGAQRAQLRDLHSVELHESCYRLEWMDDPWDDLREAGEWLLALEAAVAPDVVHLNGYVHGALPWRAPVLVCAHSCVLSWWRAVKHEPAPESWGRYADAVREGVAAANVVVAPTRAMLRSVEEHYGTPVRSVVIPNGRGARPHEPVRKQPLVLAAGRLWDDAKNFTTLDAAAARVRWPVYVAGDPRHPNGSGVELANARALGALGADELATWYAHAAIFAHPANYEPFGIAPLEAALANCALVLGDIPTLREVWGDAALFVPPDDADALADALTTLADDVKLCDAMGARARQCAEHYSPRRMAESYTAVYRSLADMHATPFLPEAMAHCVAGAH